MSRSYRIGVDGGASKTECILINESGEVLARHLAKGCSPSVLNPEEAARLVSGALATLLAKVGLTQDEVAGVLLCMAGDRDFWKEFARSLTGFGRALAVDDSLPILELAVGDAPGLVLHGGTGSFVAARTLSSPLNPRGRTHYAGGLGWRFGDPGSGYDLGQRGIARALLELQDCMPPSGIASLVCAHTGLENAAGISRHFYSQSGLEPQIAALAPGILRLAANRDSGAQAIVTESASKLLELAVQMAAVHFSPQPLRGLRVALSGPIMTHPIVVEILRDRAPFALGLVTAPAIEGVTRMLARSFESGTG